MRILPRRRVRRATLAAVICVASTYAVAAPASAHSLAGGGARPSDVGVAAKPSSGPPTLWAGSAHWLVYTLPAVNGQVKVKARSRSGHTRSLGTVNGANGQWSLVKHHLTADLGRPGFHTTDKLAWWNLSTHHQGDAFAPPNRYYASASSDGWLLSNLSGTKYYDERHNGHVTSLGRVKGRAGYSVSGPDGFLANSEQVHPRIEYQKWSKPKHFKVLDHFHPTYSCEIPDGNHTACGDAPGDYTGTDGNPIVKLAVVSLKSGHVHSTSTCANGQKPVGGFSDPHHTYPTYHDYPVTVDHGLAIPACGALQFLSDSGKVTAVNTPLGGVHEDRVGAYGEYVYSLHNGKTVKAIGLGDKKPKTLFTQH